MRCRARGGHHRGELEECVDRHKDRTPRQRGTGHAIGHPHRNRGGLCLGPAQPDVATQADAALYANRLAVQRMPRIVHRDVFNVVGAM